MNTTSMLALSLCSGAAFAGQTVYLHFSVDNTEPHAGDTHTWTLTARFEGYSDPTAYFAGFDGNIIASNTTQAEITGYTNLMSRQQDGASVSGSQISDLNIFNHALFRTNDPSNPLDILTITTRVTADLTTSLSFDAVGRTAMIEDAGAFSPIDWYTDFIVTSDTVYPNPAPGSIALLAIGALATTQRRR